MGQNTCEKWSVKNMKLNIITPVFKRYRSTKIGEIWSAVPYGSPRLTVANLVGNKSVWIGPSWPAFHINHTFCAWWTGRSARYLLSRRVYLSMFSSEDLSFYSIPRAVFFQGPSKRGEARMILFSFSLIWSYAPAGMWTWLDLWHSIAVQPLLTFYCYRI